MAISAIEPPSDAPPAPSEPSRPTTDCWAAADREPLEHVLRHLPYRARGAAACVSKWWRLIASDGWWKPRLLVLTWGARIPVIRVGRMAGQYAKPRSSDTETVDGQELLSYRGDIVNGIQKSARDADPSRLITAYHHSAATLNYARALVDGGFADLHHPQHWDLGFVRSSANRAAYEDIVDRIRDAIDFVESTGVRGTAALKTVELFCSHEGLLLDYEGALTELVGERWYNLGAHFLWIGDRTRQLDGAHVEYFRGLENPIGIKAGPSMAPADLGELITTLEPANRPGRITVITRLGAGRIAEALPPLVQAVQAAGRTIGPAKPGRPKAFTSDKARSERR